MKKVCVATATRAEYGLLKPLMTELLKSKDFELQILATGAHLSPEFGLTYKTIENDGFVINQKVEMLLSADTSTSIVKSMGIGMQGYADAISQLSPDFMVILGDRYEMLALASSALIFNIPIIHIHGGEITEGAYDDAIRHSISKMSHIHFASTEEYKQRIIQLGENPEYVYNVGAIGIDNIVSLPLLNKEELENELGIKFKRYNYQVTFHPSTLDKESPQEQFQKLLNVIDLQEDSFFVFTKANADTGGRIINQMIDDYIEKNPNKSKAFTSLGTLRFLSVVQFCDAIVGNSSSGILEAPSLKTATINIGNRQKGRVQASSVVNSNFELDQLLNSFSKIKSSNFKTDLIHTKSPYGMGGTSQKMIEVLERVKTDNFQTKSFHNLKN